MPNAFLEKQDEVVYYDTCENPEELKVIEQTMGQDYANLSEMTMLRQKTKQLETKRGTVCARRAYLRNKKVNAVLERCILFSWCLDSRGMDRKQLEALGGAYKMIQDDSVSRPPEGQMWFWASFTLHFVVQVPV